MARHATVLTVDDLGRPRVGFLAAFAAPAVRAGRPRFFGTGVRSGSGSGSCSDSDFGSGSCSASSSGALRLRSVLRPALFTVSTLLAERGVLAVTVDLAGVAVVADAESDGLPRFLAVDGADTGDFASAPASKPMSASGGPDATGTGPWSSSVTTVRPWPAPSAAKGSREKSSSTELQSGC